MNDRACVELLTAMLPRLGLRWRGFSNLRGQVCKRIHRRMKELGVAELAVYRQLLERDPDELRRFDSFCRVTITRFYRDRAVFDTLRTGPLAVAAAAAARERRKARCWSAGCASGEEPYTLAMVFELDLARRFDGLGYEIVATEADAALLERARRACYPSATVRDLPSDWKTIAFDAAGKELCLRERFRSRVAFAQQDLRHAMPDGPFDVILCRNVAFTYFDEALQLETLARFRERLTPGGALVIGGHERLPEGADWVALPGQSSIRLLEPIAGSR